MNEVTEQNPNGAGAECQYKPEYCDKMREYFNLKPTTVVEHGGKIKRMPVEFPTMAGFAASIGHGKSTLHDWSKKFSEFSEAIEECKGYQENILVVNALGGGYNSPFSMFFAKNNLGYVDKREVKIEDKKDTLDKMAEDCLDDDEES